MEKIDTRFYFYPNRSIQFVHGSWGMTWRLETREKEKVSWESKKKGGRVRKRGAGMGENAEYRFRDCIRSPGSCGSEFRCPEITVIHLCWFQSFRKSMQILKMSRTTCSSSNVNSLRWSLLLMITYSTAILSSFTTPSENSRIFWNHAYSFQVKIRISRGFWDWPWS